MFTGISIISKLRLGCTVHMQKITLLKHVDSVAWCLQLVASHSCCRPPGVEGDEGDEAPPGADPPAADIPATDPSHPAAAPVSGVPSSQNRLQAIVPCSRPHCVAANHWCLSFMLHDCCIASLGNIDHHNQQISHLQ